MLLCLQECIPLTPDTCTGRWPVRTPRYSRPIRACPARRRLLLRRRNSTRRRLLLRRRNSTRRRLLLRRRNSTRRRLLLHSRRSTRRHLLLHRRSRRSTRSRSRRSTRSRSRRSTRRRSRRSTRRRSRRSTRRRSRRSTRRRSRRSTRRRSRRSTRKRSRRSTRRYVVLRSDSCCSSGFSQHGVVFSCSALALWTLHTLVSRLKVFFPFYFLFSHLADAFIQIFLLYTANLQDRTVLVMWSEKFSWSSITSPRFLAVFEGVMVDEPNWKVKLWFHLPRSGPSTEPWGTPVAREGVRALRHPSS